ncbi:MAG: acyltransferase family protein [Lachnospiraceae bacterium]
MEQLNSVKVSRINFIDISKGIGILLVILGHAGNIYVESFVGLFHMSLFIFISGFLWNDTKYASNPKLLFYNRFKTLYIPYLKYELLFFILRGVFLSIGWYNPSNITVPSTMTMWGKELLKIILCMGREEFLGAFWFLVMLLFINIEFSCISWFSRKICTNYLELYRGLLVVGTFLTGTLMAKYFPIPRFTPSLLGMIFFYLGWLAQRYQVFSIFYARFLEQKKYKFGICLCLLTAFLSLLIFWKYGTISTPASLITDPPFYLINGLAGIFIVLTVSLLCQRTPWNHFLSFLGANTIELLAFHEIGFKPVSFLLHYLLFPTVLIDTQGVPVGIQNGFYFVAYFIGSLIFCLLVLFIKGRIMKGFRLIIRPK